VHDTLTSRERTFSSPLESRLFDVWTKTIDTVKKGILIMILSIIFTSLAPIILYISILYQLPSGGTHSSASFSSVSLPTHPPGHPCPPSLRGAPPWSICHAGGVGLRDGTSKPVHPQIPSPAVPLQASMELLSGGPRLAGATSAAAHPVPLLRVDRGLAPTRTKRGLRTETKRGPLVTVLNMNLY
jgi:hypothetical protein